MKFLPFIVVLATVYHATEKECDKSFLVTANGTKIESTESAFSQKILAVSQDLLKEYPLGSKVELSGCKNKEYNGKWVINDVMASRWSNRIDLLINPGMPLMCDSIVMKKVVKDE